MVLSPSGTEKKHSVALSINLMGLHEWFDGRLDGVLDIAVRADAAGLDEISLPDHVVLGEDTSDYPYGSFGMPSSYPFYEPVTMLASLASITKQIALTAIVLTPLRSAVFLAKQLATLDVLSNGRVNIGFGIGWHKTEYDFSGIPWEGRFGRMDEQVEACRALWTEAPASYHGKTVSFDRAYSLPFPVQPGGIPIWFGLPPTDRNFDRIARHGGGWYPMLHTPQLLKENGARLRAAYERHGTNPSLLTIRTVLLPIKGAAGEVDLTTSLDQIPAFVDAGATTIELHPKMFCSGPQDVDGFLAALASYKQRHL